MGLQITHFVTRAAHQDVVRCWPGVGRQQKYQQQQEKDTRRPGTSASHLVVNEDTNSNASGTGYCSERSDEASDEYQDDFNDEFDEEDSCSSGTSTSSPSTSSASESENERLNVDEAEVAKVLAAFRKCDEFLQRHHIRPEYYCRYEDRLALHAWLLRRVSDKASRFVTVYHSLKPLIAPTTVPVEDKCLFTPWITHC
ncbi:hypothetical protein QAD02_024029 [Eretmocerus hayati]|uniref:Uncharacterized protein n=1 Tax=Eretmocerus hayati TaxID=131215 RepID=A0ACC2Q031_9HYME|nr:hypothetical protein QAD02_024029 [Eretmocerus hayati]